MLKLYGHHFNVRLCVCVCLKDLLILTLIAIYKIFHFLGSAVLNFSRSCSVNRKVVNAFQANKNFKPLRLGQYLEFKRRYTLPATYIVYEYRTSLRLQ
jgi:hypothetical protein